MGVGGFPYKKTYQTQKLKGILTLTRQQSLKILGYPGAGVVSWRGTN